MKFVQTGAKQPAVAASVQLVWKDRNDQELLVAIADGDRDAFTELVDRYADRWFSLAYRLLGRRSDAEDVVQETFTRLWANPLQYRPLGGAQFSTWAYRVVMNRCLDMKRQPVAQALFEIEELADPLENAETALIRLHRDRAIAAAIAELPERQRAAIVLTYTTGLKNNEAASVMEVSLKAFEALLVRAKKTLRQALIDEDETEHVG